MRVRKSDIDIIQLLLMVIGNQSRSMDMDRDRGMRVMMKAGDLLMLTERGRGRGAERENMTETGSDTDMRKIPRRLLRCLDGTGRDDQGRIEQKLIRTMRMMRGTMIDTIIIIIISIVRIGMILDPRPNPIRINITTGLDLIPTFHLLYLIDTRPHPLIRTSNVKPQIKSRTVCKSLSNTKVCPTWEVCR
jgi:hypothetical protein